MDSEKSIRAPTMEKQKSNESPFAKMPFYKRQKTMEGKMTITASSSDCSGSDLGSLVKEEYNVERNSSNSNVLGILPSEKDSITD